MRKTIQEIIQGSNLDNITMKIVIEQVNSKYPNHDLNDKKTVIKNLVKEVNLNFKNHFYLCDLLIEYYEKILSNLPISLCIAFGFCHVCSTG